MSIPKNESLLQTAIAYAQMRYAVFPCHAISSDGRCSCTNIDCGNQGKHPRTPNGFKDASKDVAVIQEWWRRWPTANIAIATGTVSGVDVLDVDPRHLGDVFLLAFETKHGQLPDTPSVVTGGDGNHYYFACPDDVVIGSSAGEVGSGIDVRSNRGYVIVPPSNHLSGKPYSWASPFPFDRRALAPMPEWLKDRAAKRKNGSRPERFDIQGTIAEGVRNDTLFRVGCALREVGLDEQDIIVGLVHMNTTRCSPPLENAEVRQIARSAAKAPDRPQATQGTKKPEWPKGEEQWPDEVEGDALIQELIAAIHTFVMIDDSAAFVAALWVLFTWTFKDWAETNPYLRIISPTPGCGKSTILKVLQRVVRSPKMVASITPAAFRRALDQSRFTMLLDEGDAFLNGNEMMRNVLDAASDPETANTMLCDPSPRGWKIKEYNVFVPIAIASIGPLYRMQTVEERAIALHLKRATASEIRQLSKGRSRELRVRLEPLVKRCARWAVDNAESLKNNARPALPDGMNGREQDKWEPLIAIADTLGPRWGERARNVAIAISGTQDDEEKPQGVLLLKDISEIFEAKAEQRLSSQMICEELAKLENRPWGEYGKSQKAISTIQLAKLLRPFGITSHSARLTNGDNLKSYKLADFADAFERYLSSPKESAAPDPSENQAREHDERNHTFHAAQDPEHLNKRTAAYIAKAAEDDTGDDYFGEEAGDIYESDYDSFDEEVETASP